MQWEGKNPNFCDYFRDAACAAKTFLGPANISFMFLSSWSDWGIDISDFEKINFMNHERLLGVSAAGQADFLQQRHLRHGTENFQKAWYEKFF